MNTCKSFIEIALLSTNQIIYCKNNKINTKAKNGT